MPETHKCRYPGCSEDALDYTARNGHIRHQKYCRYHHNEQNKKYASSRPAVCKLCGKAGTRATIISGKCSECKDKKIDRWKSEGDFFKMAKEYNKTHPIKPEFMEGLASAFKNMQRIPSGGRINKIRIEGE